MEIRFVRLEDDVCARVNAVAQEAGRTVSEVVNEIVREHLPAMPARAADGKPVK